MPKDKVVCWTDPGGCSSCKFCGMDMDMDPYCVHPKVLENHPYGYGINHAIRETCGTDLNLWEKRA
jgi:hypothetical protein